MNVLPYALSFAAVFAIFAGATLLICYLPYPNFAIVRRMFVSHRFQRIVDAEARLTDLGRGIEQAADIEDCWARLREGSREFGFQGLRLSIDGAVFKETGSASQRLWQMRIPLAEGRYVNFFREFDSIDPLIMGPFANSIERGLKLWLAAQKSDPIWLPWLVSEANEANIFPGRAAECGPSLEASGGGKTRGSI